MARIICSLQDMGCIQNAFPVAEYLASTGQEVALLVNQDGLALTKLNELDPNIPVVTEVASSDVLVTCLPTWTLDNNLIPDETQVILIAENAQVNDARLRVWLKRSNVQVVGMTMPGIEVVETGLPAVVTVAERISSLTNEGKVKSIREKHRGEIIISVALPGDWHGCERMLKTLRLLKCGTTSQTFIIARTHPKLPTEDAKQVAKELSWLGALPLEEANSDLNVEEQMALAKEGLFICDWNSTMALQAAGAGVPVGLLPPANQDTVEWVTTTGLILEGQALPFLGTYPSAFQPSPKSMDTLNPAVSIAKIAMETT